MSQKIVFMFPGQGAQYYQMGKELFENNPVFKKWMLDLDIIAKDLGGESILDQIYKPHTKKSDNFDRLRYTHPAVFMIEYAMAQVLLDLKVEPDFILGSSLGEYASFTLSGTLRAEDALSAIIQQAKLLEETCDPGGMTAILKPIDHFHNSPILHEQSELSSINMPMNFGVSASIPALERIESHLKQEKVLFQRLPVLYAFHSKLIDIAETPFLATVQALPFQTPKIPIISCMTQGPIQQIEPSFLWNIVRKPIEFQNTINGLAAQGDMTYIDLGPSGTLANFVKYNLSRGTGARMYHIMTPLGRDLQNLEKFKSEVS